MSLVLRKECQEALNNAGLSEYHIAIQHKAPKIVTKCGQNFIYIRGISFARDNPSKSEIAIAGELIRDFLIEKSPVIKMWHRAEAELAALKATRDAIPEELRKLMFSEYITEGLIDSEGKVCMLDYDMRDIDMTNFKEEPVPIVKYRQGTYTVTTIAMPGYAKVYGLSQSLADRLIDSSRFKMDRTLLKSMIKLANITREIIEMERTAKGLLGEFTTCRV